LGDGRDGLGADPGDVGDGPGGQAGGVEGVDVRADGLGVGDAWSAKCPVEAPLLLVASVVGRAHAAPFVVGWWSWWRPCSSTTHPWRLQSGQSAMVTARRMGAWMRATSARSRWCP